MLCFLSGLHAGASCLCLAQRTSHSCTDDGHCTVQARFHSWAPRSDDCFDTHPLFLWQLLTHLGDGMVSPSRCLNETGSDTFLSSQPMASVSVYIKLFLRLPTTHSCTLVLTNLFSFQLGPGYPHHHCLQHPGAPHCFSTRKEN